MEYPVILMQINGPGILQFKLAWCNYSHLLHELNFSPRYRSALLLDNCSLKNQSTDLSKYQ